jgi:RNA polymerase sigma factor for flagellar operon FliA
MVSRARRNAPAKRAVVAPKRNRRERDRLAEEYLPLVRHVVSRIAMNLPSHVDSDELFQVGSVGLVNASRSFDEKRGVAFKTYAFALIRGAILDELRRLDIVPRSTREKIRAMDQASAKLAQQLDRPPAPAEVAAALGTTESNVLDLIRAARTVAMLSLDDGAASPEALLVRDILPCPNALDPGDAAAQAELIEAVADRIGSLPEAERRVITMYYREGLLLREIGEILGVTESRVSQIHSRALARLQEMLRGEQGA